MPGAAGARLARGAGRPQCQICQGMNSACIVIPAKARLQGCTPAWMQVVERRREQAAEESSAFDYPFPPSGNDDLSKTLIRDLNTVYLRFQSPWTAYLC